MTSAAPDVQGTRNRGASNSLRSMVSWRPVIGSPTSDLPAHEQRTLRARSRDAFRGHMLARAVITRCRTNIVGTGLMFRPSVDFRVLGIDADRADEINAQIHAAWSRYAEDPAECDWESTLDFYGLQGLALVSAMVSGDVFAITPHALRPGGVNALKVQLIEADRISNRDNGPDTANCIDGVEMRAGVPIGYWVCSKHPGDATSNSLTRATWAYHPAYGGTTGRRRVIHVINEKDRPGQVRGVPYLAPILEPLQQLTRYSDAELMAAVISSMLTIFIERADDDDDPLLDDDGNPVAAIDGTDAGGMLSLGNGAIIDLAHGEKANAVNPARPNAQFDPFFDAIVKQIGAALELPIDELLLQYEKSYSAARAAMLQAWRFYSLRRWYLVQQFCRPMFGLWLDEEVASGRLDLPGYADPIRRRAWSTGQWIGPARGAMDEYKEAQAAALRISTGLSNEAMETAAMTGEDWQTVYAQRQKEIEQRRADGTYVIPRDGRGSPLVAPDPEDDE